jgi:hypothetical protein
MKNLEARIVMFSLLCLTLIANASGASQFGLGVKAGDWIGYTVQQYSGLGSTQFSQKLEFLSVEGTNVTIRQTTYTSSGTEMDQTERSGDLASTEYLPMTLFTMNVYVIPANLTTGDSVYLGSGFGNETIIGETTRTYAGADRRVVYSNFSLPQYGGQQAGSQYTFYWDKQTGVLVEGAMTLSFAFNAVLVSDTNMWSEGFNWWFWIVTIAIVVSVTIALIINIKEKSRGKNDASRTLSTAKTLAVTARERKH